MYSNEGLLARAATPKLIIVLSCLDLGSCPACRHVRGHSAGRRQWTLRRSLCFELPIYHRTSHWIGEHRDNREIIRSLSDHISLDEGRRSSRKCRVVFWVPWLVCPKALGCDLNNRIIILHCQSLRRSCARRAIYGAFYEYRARMSESSLL